VSNPDAALKLAVDISAKPPIATLGTKRVLNYSRDHSVAEGTVTNSGLEYVAVWNASMLNSRDTTIAAMSVITKTPTVFPKL
jgi:uncharacterized protein YbjT (DUF2867 family)